MNLNSASLISIGSQHISEKEEAKQGGIYNSTLVSNTETPSDAPPREAYPRTARPHRRPAEAESEKIPPCRDYNRLQPYVPHHLSTLRPTPSRQEVQPPSGFSTKHPRRPSMAEYVLRCKHLLTTPPMILVPEKNRRETVRDEAVFGASRYKSQQPTTC